MSLRLKDCYCQDWYYCIGSLPRFVVSCTRNNCNTKPLHLWWNDVSISEQYVAVSNSKNFSQHFEEVYKFWHIAAFCETRFAPLLSFPIPYGCRHTWRRMPVVLMNRKRVCFDVCAKTILITMMLIPEAVLFMVPSSLTESLQEFTQFIWWMQNSAECLPTLRPSQLTLTKSLLVICYHLLPPSPFNITRPES